MKRSGFTMIELIFVIVILGILAAVALPKFIGIADQAEGGKCEAFVGTLNRTVGPMMWAASRVANAGTASEGQIDGLTQSDYMADTEIPTKCLSGATDFTDDYADITFGSSTFDFGFTEGTASESPKWTWTKQ